MPNLNFIGMEIITLISFVLCLRHAWRKGVMAVLYLIAGVLFGLLLELATVWQLNAYSYGDFLVMVADIPLTVGVSWGCIIYSTMLFSNATNLPEWARPVLDGLMGLTIDLAMDAIAIRLGMWDWGLDLQLQYFGVPFANFWAWFWVVTSFSAGIRLLAPHAKGFWRWLSPFGAIVIGCLTVLATNALISFAVPPFLREPLIALTLGSALLLVLFLRPRFLIHSVDPLVFWVPFSLHASFLIAGLISGVILRPPLLLVVSVAMIVLTFYLHRSPST